MRVMKNGIYPTDGIIYGADEKHGPWALIKVKGEAKGELYQLWIKNPEQIKDCEQIRIAEILTGFSNQNFVKSRNRWYTNVNFEVLAMPADASYRETPEGMVTPEDDIAKFLFGLQGGG